MLISSIFLLEGCASTPAPHQQVSHAESAIRNADEAGARTHAPLQFHKAEKKLGYAKDSLKEKEYTEAEFFAEEAEIDAELAFVTSRAIKAQRSVDELNESIRDLRSEIEREGSN